MCFTRCKTERKTSQIDADSFSVFEIYRNDVGSINLFTPRNWDFSSLSEASKFYLCVTMYHRFVSFNDIFCSGCIIYAKYLFEVKLVNLFFAKTQNVIKIH